MSRRFTLLCFLAIGAFFFTACSQQKDSLGKSTVNAIKNGKNVIGCSDAKTIVRMMLADNGQIMDYIALSSASGSSTPEMRKSYAEFDAKMDKFESYVLGSFLKSENKEDDIRQALGTGFRHIAQAATVSHLGLYSKKELEEFINAEFCGGALPEGFSSPLDFSAEDIQKAMNKKYEGRPEFGLSSPQGS